VATERRTATNRNPLYSRRKEARLAVQRLNKRRTATVARGKAVKDTDVGSRLNTHVKRANAARAYLTALRAESRYIRQALEILTSEEPRYGDEALARDLSVDPDRVAHIRKAAGLAWHPCVRRSESAAAHQRVLDTLKTNGGNVKATARTTGVPETTVRRWKEKYLSPEVHRPAASPTN
jgi:hypothetical protein